MTVTVEDDIALLREVLDADGDEDTGDGRRSLYVREREVFADWLASGLLKPLSAKQRAWLEKAAVRVGVLTELPTANVFSAWDKSKQDKERALAKRQPFEDMPRPLRPPRRAP